MSEPSAGPASTPPLRALELLPPGASGDSLADMVSALHAEAFPDEPWSPAAFHALMAMPGARLLLAGEARLDGFLLLRAAGGEGEVIALAVRAQARRAGLGRALLARGLSDWNGSGLEAVFLEVAEDNAAARALYADFGFREVGRRPRYYARRDGDRVDALVLRRDLGAGEV